MERLQEQEVPFAPVYGTDEVLADPQVRHLGSIYEIAQAGAEPLRAIRRPVRYDGERGPTRLRHRASGNTTNACWPRPDSVPRTSPN